jgi:myo-inositol-1(or 4)-monophosphatase
VASWMRGGCGCWIAVGGRFHCGAGSPMAAILWGLLHDGDAVAGLRWLSFTGERYVAVWGGC